MRSYFYHVLELFHQLKVSQTTTASNIQSKLTEGIGIRKICYLLCISLLTISELPMKCFALLALWCCPELLKARGVPRHKSLGVRRGAGLIETGRTLIDTECCNLFIESSHILASLCILFVTFKPLFSTRGVKEFCR